MHDIYRQVLFFNLLSKCCFLLSELLEKLSESTDNPHVSVKDLLGETLFEDKEERKGVLGEINRLRQLDLIQEPVQINGMCGTNLNIESSTAVANHGNGVTQIVCFALFYFEL